MYFEFVAFYPLQILFGLKQIHLFPLFLKNIKASYGHVKKYMKLPVSQLSFRLTSANTSVKLQASFAFASIKPNFLYTKMGSYYSNYVAILSGFVALSLSAKLEKQLFLCSLGQR